MKFSKESLMEHYGGLQKVKPLRTRRKLIKEHNEAVEKGEKEGKKIPYRKHAFEARKPKEEKD